MSSSDYGAFEWCSKTKNCARGCEHMCLYCYAMFMAVCRFHRLDLDGWKEMVVDEKAVNKKYPKYDGTVMFPSSHDITPKILEACLIVLAKLFSAGNDVLVVSKPHFECIVAICQKFADYRDNLCFRFTIGALTDDILRQWEPGAPGFAERFKCLKYAYQHGFKVGVSIEPLLDSDNVVALVNRLMPYVNDTIWIGKLNGIDSRVRVTTDADRAEVERVRAGQTDERIIEIYEALKDNPLVRWKDSIRKVLEQNGIQIN